MYAIALSGGKQYKVSKDDIVSVEKINAEPGEKVKLDVIMISDEGKVTTGNPIKGASVEVGKRKENNRLQIQVQEKLQKEARPQTAL